MHKSELEDRLSAYNDVKAELAKRHGSSVEEKLQSLTNELLDKKEHLENDTNKNMSVQLHKRAYEIDFDAYWRKKAKNEYWNYYIQILIFV